MVRGGRVDGLKGGRARGLVGAGGEWGGVGRDRGRGKYGIRPVGDSRIPKT